MYLVTQSKRKENILAFDCNTGEYVYFHNGNEIWREKGDKSLLVYFNQVRSGMSFDEETIVEMPTYNIWNKYCESCYKLDLEKMNAILGGRKLVYEK